MGSDTTVLGKRKRVKQQQPKSEPKPAEKAKVDDAAAAAERAALEEAQAIFRRHFEAQFVPLQESEEDASGKKGGKARAGTREAEGGEDGQGGVEDLRSDSEGDDDDDDDDEEDDQDEDWDGLSGEDDDDDEAETDSEEDNQVEVVDHSKPLATSTLGTPQSLMGMTKREMRAYLSSRPPDALSEAERSKAKQLLLNKAPGDDSNNNDGTQNEDSKALLAKDLELQRLISESHILSASNPFNTTTSGAARLPFAGGRTRALTTDLRLRGLGSKGSIFAQQKMPMGMRKGITGAKAEREERRRREAKENGIILERPAGGVNGGGGGKKKKKEQRRRSGGGGGGSRRDLAVDMPGMGRMKGGELRLSKREVRAVEMEGKRMDTGKRRRRRR
ncbi:Protein FAF1 [Cytospora mali]|uniref:Protein FAF1 n=1 Tax=Cytospora mali TaxID=578113 RepID=A0A194VPD5_CYTMA|nr:Protein FAF1 [Valsa mali]